MTRRGAFDFLCHLLAHAVERDVAHPFTRADWRVLLDVAHQTHVVTALHGALRRAGLLALAPDEVAAHLAELHGRNRRRNHELRAELVAVARSLNDAGIVPAVLKGGALLLDGTYGDAGERLLTDVDLLVPRQALVRARSVLAHRGYRGVGRTKAPHHLQAVARPGCVAVLEVHWRILPNEAARQVLVEIARAAPWCETAIDGARVRLPSPTLVIAHRCLHDLVHDRGYPRGWLSLRGLMDAQRLVDRAAPIDWGALDRAFARRGLGAVWRAYRHTAHRHFPAIPEGTAPDLAARAWHWRFVAHQQWPAVFLATRWLFQRVRPRLPLEWLRYWGWPVPNPGNDAWKKLSIRWGGATSRTR